MRTIFLVFCLTFLVAVAHSFATPDADEELYDPRQDIELITIGDDSPRELLFSAESSCTEEIRPPPHKLRTRKARKVCVPRKPPHSSTDHSNPSQNRGPNPDINPDASPLPKLTEPSNEDRCPGDIFGIRRIPVCDSGQPGDVRFFTEYGLKLAKCARYSPLLGCKQITDVVDRATGRKPRSQLWCCALFEPNPSNDGRGTAYSCQPAKGPLFLLEPASPGFK